jgi:GTPase
MNSILLVGRTNAGKSSLFNALLGKSLSVVDSTANLTNDIVKFSSGNFAIYDSPGFENLGEFEKFLKRVGEVDCVCIVCDPNDYSHALCKSILSYFNDKECILVINKVDLVKDVSRFGFGGIEVFPVSTIHKTNIDKLRTRLNIPGQINRSTVSGWSIFGRANVGKSSIANYLVGFERFTTMNKVGTTREINQETSQKLNITLIDTPGYRKNNSMNDLDKASQYRLEDHIKKSNSGFAIFVIDAEEGFLRTDRVIINKILEKFTLFFVINKVDLVDEIRIQNIEVEIKRMYPNVDYVFCSTVTNVGQDKLIKLIKNITKTGNAQISTPQLNKWLQRQHNRHIKYIVQKDPRNFILFTKRTLDQTQIRWLENGICNHFGIRGTRLKFDVRVG